MYNATNSAQMTRLTLPLPSSLLLSSLAVIGSSSSPPPHRTISTSTAIPPTTTTAAVTMTRRSKTDRNEIAMWRLLRNYLSYSIVRYGGGEDDGGSPANVVLLLLKRKVAREYFADSPERQLAFFRWMLVDRRYSSTYARAIRDMLAKHVPSFVPWSSVVTIPVAVSTTTTTTLPPMGESRVTLKSDGRLTFSEREYDLMLRRCESEIMATIEDRTTTTTTTEEKVTARSCCQSLLPLQSRIMAAARYRAFLYTFYMLARTGKRLSDVAEITPRQLGQLRDRGVCVIKIRKTGKLGRIEIPELLDHRRRRVVVDNNYSSDGGDDDKISAFLETFVAWVDSGMMLIPFRLSSARRSLDTELDAFYRRVVGGARPRGLSFHALRRIYAGYRFLHGASIERLRENLDHSTRRQTNRYVNSCLYEIDATRSSSS